MGRLSRWAVVIAAAAAALAWGGPDALVPLKDAAAATSQVSVAFIVDFGGSDKVDVGCVKVPSTDNGYAALLAFTQQEDVAPPTYANSGLLCSIGGIPSSGCGQVDGDGYIYWSYWHGDSGQGEPERPTAGSGTGLRRHLRSRPTAHHHDDHEHGPDLTHHDGGHNHAGRRRLGRAHTAGPTPRIDGDDATHRHGRRPLDHDAGRGLDDVPWALDPVPRVGTTGHEGGGGHCGTDAHPSRLGRGTIVIPAARQHPGHRRDNSGGPRGQLRRGGTAVDRRSACHPAGGCRYRHRPATGPDRLTRSDRPTSPRRERDGRIWPGQVILTEPSLTRTSPGQAMLIGPVSAPSGTATSILVAEADVILPAMVEPPSEVKATVGRT